MTDTPIYTVETRLVSGAAADYVVFSSAGGARAYLAAGGKTGGAVCVMCLLSGMNVWAALLVAVLAGLATGLVTGLLHTFMGIPAILAGILTQLALYSINLKIMGKANQSINVDKYGLLISLRWVKEFALHNPIIMVILATAVVIGVLYWFFGTELGCGIRATGSNPAMSRAQGINTNFNIVLGLAVSNALVALSGACLFYTSPSPRD